MGAGGGVYTTLLIFILTKSLATNTYTIPGICTGARTRGGHSTCGGGLGRGGDSVTGVGSDRSSMGSDVSTTTTGVGALLSGRRRLGSSVGSGRGRIRRTGGGLRRTGRRRRGRCSTVGLEVRCLCRGDASGSV